MNSKKIIYSSIAGLIFITLIYISSRNMSSRPYYQEIPVKFGISDVPIVEMEIDGTTYPIGICLASKFPMSFPSSILKNINKNPQGKVQWKTAIGTSFESPSYGIPNIKIGNLVWTGAIAIEGNEESFEDVILWERPDTAMTHNKYVGTLGRPFFEKYNVLFDFRHARMIISNDIKKMKKEGFDLEKMVKTPLKEGRGFIVSATTDLGIKNFGISTDSTINVIRASLLQDKECEKEQRGLDTYTTSKFLIGDNDLGEMTLYSIAIPPELHEMEGALGMSFLANHVVYFDCQNKIVYIEK